MSTEFSATELVDIARQVERCGEAFYRRAGVRVSNPAVRDLFEHLASEEVSHAVEFERLLARLGGGPEDWRQDDEYVAYMRSLAFGRVFPTTDAVEAAVDGLKGEREALSLAIRFENDTIAFLRGLSRMVRPEDRSALEEMVAEEEGHVRRLASLAEKLPPEP